MGNKNARSLKLSTSLLPGSRKKFDDSSKSGADVNIAPPTSTPKQSGDVSDKADGRPAHLRFRSFQEGTLVTNNGQPTTQFQEQSIATPIMKKTVLSGATPAFIPSGSPALQRPTPQRPAPPVSFNNNIETPQPVAAADSASIQKLMNTLHTRDSAPQAATSHPVSTFTTPARTMSTAFSIPPIMPDRPARTFFMRPDKTKKDIIVTSTGVVRNTSRVTERVSPNGQLYLDFANDFTPGKYDFLDALAAMSPEQRKDFWAHNWLEIEVDLRTRDAGVETNNKEKEVNDAINMMASMNVNGKNADEEKKEASNAETQEEHPLIANIRNLGPDCFENVSQLFITIYFHTVHPSTINDSAAHHSAVVVPPPTPNDLSFLTSLVTQCASFVSLKRMETVMRTPSNTKHPIMLPQLQYMLPFYDLDYTDWFMKWQSDFMTRAEEVAGWPLNYLDRERDRICWERAKKLQGARYIRKSQFQAETERGGYGGRADGSRAGYGGGGYGGDGSRASYNDGGYGYSDGPRAPRGGSGAHHQWGQ